MAAVYVDTSAFGRELLDEPTGPAVVRELITFEQRISSRLLRIELRRLGLRHGIVERADQLLSGLSLVPIDEATLAAAETIAPASVATLDAIHLVTAVRLRDAGRLDAVMTYDARLAEGARHHGLPVLTPA